MGEEHASKLKKSIMALRGQKGIADISLQDDQTYLITTNSFFQDNEPVRIQLKTSEQCDEELVATDCGDTLARLRALVDVSRLDESVRSHLRLWSALNITRQEDELTVGKVGADSLLYSITTLALACALLVKLEKTMADFTRSRQEEERRKQDEREARSFRLSSREEVVAFENRLHEFSLRESVSGSLPFVGSAAEEPFTEHWSRLPNSSQSQIFKQPATPSTSWVDAFDPAHHRREPESIRN